MPFIEERLGDESLSQWDVVDAEQLSSESLTEDEEEYATCDEGDPDSELDVDTECTPSLYAQLSDSADAVVLDFRTAEEQGAVSVTPSTLAVFFFFQDAGKREACWYMLQRTLKVSTDAWLDPELEHLPRGDGRTCECDGLSLVLLLRLDIPLLGHYTVAELDRKLEDLLGCPRGRGGRMNVILRRAARISYEIVPEHMRKHWLLEREEVLGVCSKCFISVLEQEEKESDGVSR
ncbi:MAG: hypothetical protein ACRERD_13535 [Candidatus Binatia bacterium]